MSLVEHEVISETEQRALTLEAAALEIEVRGWGQGKLCTTDGRVCMSGAIAAAAGFEPRDTIAFEVAYQVWFGRNPGSNDRVGECIQALRLPMWNDQPERTVEEVTARLRSRAAELRSI